MGIRPRPDVLVVSELYPPSIGGSAVLLYEIYRRLHGLSVHVLTDSTGERGAAALPPGPSVSRLPIRTREWGLANPGGTWHHLRVGRFIRKLADSRRTLVHCGRALPEGVAALASYILWGAPYICWSHGEDVSTALTSRELTWVMTRVYRSAVAVIANSENTRTLLLQLGLEPERVHVVYPGVDPERFTPATDGTAVRRNVLAGDGTTMLLSVGRLQRRKGHDLAIEAVARLRASHPGIRYVIVGDGEERERLERMVADLGVGGMVRFAGSVSPEELPRYFAACDVFLMPNRQDGADIEGFGIVFLEAAATGKPAIGGASGGVAEAVEHGRTGLLVSGTDAAELAIAIAALADDPARRAEMGRAGRDRVIARFTWEHAARQVQAIHRLAAGTV